MVSESPKAFSKSRSCLYECRVMHHRFEPRRHRFEYGIFMLYLDLDELDSLAGRLRLFSRNRPGLYEFRDSDHLQFPPTGHAGGVRESLGRWLQTQGVQLPDDARIGLLTLPRVAGYIFNPVSFYFCQTAAGEPICAVTEVGNTFGELKPYLIPNDATAGKGNRFARVVPKHYYVSPFTAPDVCFDFKLTAPDDSLRIAINDVSGDCTLLVSTLAGSRLPLTDAGLVRLTLKYPLVTLRVITLIHWQALKLWWKRVPWHRKAADTNLQRGVFRPHATLSSAGVPESPETSQPFFKQP